MVKRLADVMRRDYDKVVAERDALAAALKVVQDTSIAHAGKQNDRIRALEAALRQAKNPHAFNCGYLKHPTGIKMVPAWDCTCGVAKLLVESQAETSAQRGTES